MATNSNKIDSRAEAKGTYLTRENWEVMKPFVHLAFKAIALIGSTLFAIVRLLPKALKQNEASPKSTPERKALKNI